MGHILSAPAKFELGGYNLTGLFDGFGRVNRFELGNEQVCWTASWLNTTTLHESERRGSPAGPLFEETNPPRPWCPIKHPMCNMDVTSDNDWVNVIEVGGKPLLLTDSATMMEMDMDTLETNRKLKSFLNDKPSPLGPPSPDFIQGGHIATSGSAHPVKRPDRSEWVSVVSSMAQVPGIEHSFLDVFTYGDTDKPQNRTLLARLKLEQSPYIHAYGVTPNYVVLPMNHKMGMPNIPHPVLLGTIQEHWKGIYIVDREGSIQLFGADWKTFDKMFYHVHIVNSFENATGVTLDVGAYNSTPFAKSGQVDIEMMRNKTIRDSTRVKNNIRRLHFHLKGPLKGETTIQDFSKIPGSTSDFFRVSPKHVGLPYCYYYATEWAHNGVDFAQMAIVKHNVCNDTKQYYTRPNTYPGEPFFIPSTSDAEDDGTVVFVALDGSEKRSLFITLDGETMEEKDVVKLPGRIPFTAHGNYFPKMSRSIMI
jgi:carotenoid cleavage dioxygenase-like enzyme